MSQRKHCTDCGKRRQCVHIAGEWVCETCRIKRDAVAERSTSNTEGALPVKYENAYLGLDQRLTWDDAVTLSDTLNRMEEATAWWIGDFLIISEKEFGEKYAQLVPEGKSQDTWRKYKWVCEKVSPSVRLAGVSFSHHEKVAKMDPDQQREWLMQVNENGWSVNGLRKAIKALSSGDDEEDETDDVDETTDPLYRHVITCPKCGHQWKKAEDEK